MIPESWESHSALTKPHLRYPSDGKIANPPKIDVAQFVNETMTESVQQLLLNLLYEESVPKPPIPTDSEKKIWVVAFRHTEGSES